MLGAGILEFNLIDDNDENWDVVKIPAAVLNCNGFLIIPTWPKWVSVGKSFVESSKRE